MFGWFFCRFCVYVVLWWFSGFCLSVLWPFCSALWVFLWVLRGGFVGFCGELWWFRRGFVGFCEVPWWLSQC